jgi:hypothetical protein
MRPSIPVLCCAVSLNRAGLGVYIYLTPTLTLDFMVLERGGFGVRVRESVRDWIHYIQATYLSRLVLLVGHLTIMSILTLLL